MDDENFNPNAFFDDPLFENELIDIEMPAFENEIEIPAFENEIDMPAIDDLPLSLIMILLNLWSLILTLLNI